MSAPQTTAVEQAIYVHQHRDTMTATALINSLIGLAEWKIFSNRQLSALTGLSTRVVGGYTNKVDNTGGNMPPESLPAVLELIHITQRGEVDIFAAKRALDFGISTRMLAKLTGIPQVTLARWGRRARALQ